jgi:hypothetical protein
MHTVVARPTPKQIALAVSAAFAMSAPLLTMAAPFTVSATYTLGSFAGPPGAINSPQTDCSNSGKDALIFTGSGANNIGIHTYGCGLQQFEFGSRSSGEGTYFVDGHTNYSDTFTGDSFSFSVSPGHTGAWGSPTFLPGEFQEASMSLLLKIDGNTHMDESFFVRVDSAGVTFNHLAPVGLLSFSTLSGPASFDFIVSSLDETLLGLGAGPHTVSYDIFTQARGNVSATSSCLAPVSGGGGGYEVGLAAVPGDGGEGGSTFAVYCGAGAQTGDPIHPFPRAIPEPDTGSLAALGVAAMAFAGLRRRKKNWQQ